MQYILRKTDLFIPQYGAVEVQEDLVVQDVLQVHPSGLTPHWSTASKRWPGAFFEDKVLTSGA